ncbi:MAG: 30S ribosomal protein S16 [Leptospira sp.]|nr:30S ribosomal protein S16 [Leptospira sp.]
MVKIRLQRIGTKNEPHYRIVAADHRSPRDGKFIDILGQYHPISKTNQVVVKDDEIIGWLKKGAQPTNTVRDLLKKSGVWKKYTASASK